MIRRIALANLKSVKPLFVSVCSNNEPGLNNASRTRFLQHRAEFGHLCGQSRPRGHDRTVETLSLIGDPKQSFGTK
jgi:hypothetical protein